jgi:hypothetical protein
MKYYLSLLLLTLLTGRGAPVSGQIQSVYLTRGTNTMMMGYFATASHATDQWLNPYLTDEWQKGHIVFSDSVYWDGKLRYDMYRKEMEMVVTRDTFYISDPFMLNEVAFGDHRFIFSLYLNKRNKKSFFGADYFEVLSSANETKFLLKRELRIDEEQFSAGKLLLGLKNEEKKRFAVNKSYYIKKTSNGPAVRIKRNKHSVLGLLSDHKKEIREFADKYNLGYRNPEDITQLVNYYNLLKQNNE